MISPKHSISYFETNTIDILIFSEKEFELIVRDFEKDFFAKEFEEQEMVFY